MNQTAPEMAAAAATNTPAEAEQGKLFGTLSYVVPFFLVLPLVQRDNGFALYHAKQALILWIAGVAASIAMTLVLVLVPIAIVGQLLSLAFMLAMLGMMVIGALAAWNLREQPLPVIGAIGAPYLASITRK